MEVLFEGKTYVFDKNKSQRVELHKGWDQYGNGSISLYGTITPYKVLAMAAYPYMDSAVLARIDHGRIVRLNESLEENCMMEVITYREPEGRRAVGDSLTLIVNAVLVELGIVCDFDINCKESSVDIQFIQPVNLERIVSKLQEAIGLNLPLRRLLMQVCSAREILQYTGNSSACDDLKSVDDDEEILLCQFKKYYGLANGYYVESSGWFAHCTIVNNLETNIIRLADL